jgi:hypothetical protein
MAKQSSNGRKIAATVGILLAGLVVGPIAAFAMLMYLGLTGELDSEWALGYWGTHILPAFVIGAVVGCCVAVHFVCRIWR